MSAHLPQPWELAHDCELGHPPRPAPALGRRATAGARPARSFRARLARDGRRAVRARGADVARRRAAAGCCSAALGPRGHRAAARARRQPDRQLRPHHRPRRARLPAQSRPDGRRRRRDRRRAPRSGIAPAPAAAVRVRGRLAFVHPGADRPVRVGRQSRRRLAGRPVPRQVPVHARDLARDGRHAATRPRRRRPSRTAAPPRCSRARAPRPGRSAASAVGSARVDPSARQLELTLGPLVVVEVAERFSPGLTGRRTATTPRRRSRASDALILAALLVDAAGPLEGDGPWQRAIAGGRRTVRLRPSAFGMRGRTMAGIVRCMSLRPRAGRAMIGACGASSSSPSTACRAWTSQGRRRRSRSPRAIFGARVRDRARHAGRGARALAQRPEPERRRARSNDVRGPIDTLLVVAGSRGVRRRQATSASSRGSARPRAARAASPRSAPARSCSPRPACSTAAARPRTGPAARALARALPAGRRSTPTRSSCATATSGPPPA